MTARSDSEPGLALAAFDRMRAIPGYILEALRDHATRRGGAFRVYRARGDDVDELVLSGEDTLERAPIP